jgi:ubiquinone/menaquinone biosynthesis C-methylase UbiE
VIDPKTIFSNKADKYARYRWDYAAGAVAAIIEEGRLSKASVVADIAAGTGILTRHFAGRVRRVYAVEPNPDMRAVAARELAALPSVSLVDGSAEATTLPAGSIDLISVAQAIHWFEPQAALQEMNRILKPDGCLAILRNNTTNDPLDGALDELILDVLGTGASAVYPQTRNRPFENYLGADYQKLTFDFQFRQKWPAFIGLLSTVSYMPAEEDPRFVKIKREAGKLFDRYSHNGYLPVRGETVLYIGRPASPTFL